MKKLILIPIVLFLFIALIFFRGLSTDPKKIPSSLIGKPIPNFVLPTLNRSKNISIVKFKGKSYILNVFATWCEACQKEHALLLKIARAKEIVILGLDYKDTAKTAQQFLDQLGNPYQSVFLDENGKTALDLGVYATPETFLVDAQGVVRYRHSGPLTEAVWEKEFLPLINNKDNTTS